MPENLVVNKGVRLVECTSLIRNFDEQGVNMKIAAGCEYIKMATRWDLNFSISLTLDPDLLPPM
jgi:hypothetical protein